MKETDISSVTLNDVIRGKVKGKTDWERLRLEETAGIEPDKDPDEGEFDWSRAQVTMPRPG